MGKRLPRRKAKRLRSYARCRPPWASLLTLVDPRIGSPLVLQQQLCSPQHSPLFFARRPVMRMAACARTSTHQEGFKLFDGEAERHLCVGAFDGNVSDRDCVTGRFSKDRCCLLEDRRILRGVWQKSARLVDDVNKAVVNKQQRPVETQDMSKWPVHRAGSGALYAAIVTNMMETSRVMHGPSLRRTSARLQTLAHEEYVAGPNKGRVQTAGHAHQVR